MAGSRDDNFFFSVPRFFALRNPILRGNCRQQQQTTIPPGQQKIKKNILTFFGVKKNRHRRCTGFSEVHQLSQKISREHIDLMEFNEILKMNFSTRANNSIACGLINWRQLHLEFKLQCKQNSDQNSTHIVKVKATDCRYFWGSLFFD